MKKYILIAVIVIALVFGYQLLNKPAEDKIIKIGLISPLSGPYAVIGEGIRDAVLLAAKDNPNIEVIVEDDEFDPKKGVTAYHKLTNIDKVDVLINTGTPSLASTQTLINEDKMVTFHLTESETRADDTVFQVLPFSYPLAKSVAEEAGKRYDRVALVYGNFGTLTTNAEYFKQGIEAKEIVYEAKIAADSDMRSEVTKLLATNPDATTVILDKETGIKFLRALRDQMGNKKVAVICDANLEITVGEYVAAVGSEILEGCISANLPGISSDKFKTDFKQAYGYDAPPLSDYGYDAASIIIDELAKEPKSSWLASLKNLAFKGISGEIKFDATGTRFPEAEMHIFQNGKFVLLP